MKRCGAAPEISGAAPEIWGLILFIFLPLPETAGCSRGAERRRLHRCGTSNVPHLLSLPPPNSSPHLGFSPLPPHPPHLAPHPPHVSLKVKEYDSITRLDQWLTTMLLRIKKTIQGEEEDLR